MSATYAVTYGDEDEGHALRLAGQGIIEFTDERVILHAHEDGGEHELSFPYAEVLPGPCNGLALRIGIVHPSAGAVVCVLHAQSYDDVAAIDGALRAGREHHVGQHIRDHAAFVSRLRAATPRVFVFGAILAVNVFVFLAMAASGVGLMNPTGSELLAWGANYGLLTMSGEWWRLLTCMFVHIGVIHIAFNMWVLNSVGQLVERIFGNALFALLYFASGLVASLVSTYFHGDTIAAGASGAIFGIIGSILGFVLRQKDEIPTATLKRIRSSTLSCIAFNVIFGLSVPGIDNAAHLGGLATGIVLGYVAARPFELQPRRRAFAGSLVAALLVTAALGAGSLFMVLGSPFARYIAAYELMERTEPEAARVCALVLEMHERGEFDGERLAAQVEGDCLSRWNAILQSLEAVTLPAEGMWAQHHARVTQVARVRVESLHALVTALRTGNETDMAEFETLSGEANALAAEISGDDDRD
jgi:rhomboid protease GluP